MKYPLIILALLFTAPAAMAEDPVIKSEKQSFRVITVADKLEHPWSLAWLPNGDMLVTERDGRLQLIRSNGTRSEITGLPGIAAEGQGGLLDVLVHPAFTKNRTIFLSYSAQDTDKRLGTEVMRAKLNGARLEDQKIIFRATPKTSGSDNHFGSRLLIGPDEKLYITLGDRYNKRDEAQNISNHLGKIIRINQDGSVPKDNPFASKENAAPEIVTYGNRNVQGIAHRPGTKQIWFHEHGARGGDEVNILKPGTNYGWPEITYGVNYSGLPITDKTALPGMEQPVIYWKPSIAPSGMAFYSGKKFPAWKDNIFVGALAKTHLRRLVLEGDQIKHQEILLQDMDERIRDVREGPDGLIYLLTDSPEGRVLKLEPAP